MRKLIKPIAAASLAISILLAGGVAAHADGVLRSFNIDIPKFGGVGHTAQQTKAIASQPARLNQVAVGGSYTINAQVCVNFNTGCGSRVNVSGSALLPNTISAGTKGVAAAMRVIQWHIVDVQVTGYFASN